MSENPFKGVPGGDPARRAQFLKHIVPVAFICAKCKQEKTENLHEDKDLTGRICVDCRKTESARKQKEQQEEADKRRAEARRREKNTPIRTKAEKLALMKDWEHAPKERCVACGGRSFVADPAMPFYNDDWERPNAIRVAKYRNDPFDYEVHEEEHPNWFCNRCYHHIEMDI